MLIVKYNLRSLLARKATAAATALGVALATLVFAASWMLAAGVTKTVGEGGRDDNAIVVRKGSETELNSNFDAQSVGLILSAPGVKKDGERALAILLDPRGRQDEAHRLRVEVAVQFGFTSLPDDDRVVVASPLAHRLGYPGRKHPRCCEHQCREGDTERRCGRRRFACKQTAKIVFYN